MPIGIVLDQCHTLNSKLHFVKRCSWKLSLSASRHLLLPSSTYAKLLALLVCLLVFYTTGKIYLLTVSVPEMWRRNAFRGRHFRSYCLS
ncbi:hypothetical protein EJ08DRAFT_219148 [Tothia fuscella]|uniref:Uncharacterized protein n=1 Tax=Tothia fuscella TaxID=1048955 RepID=A0A9P4NSA4_9PEZI|nr:hypothetical protein EJ08DRAFT_219148 [Tothia fuscella]